MCNCILKGKFSKINNNLFYDIKELLCYMYKVFNYKLVHPDEKVSYRGKITL